MAKKIQFNLEKFRSQPLPAQDDIMATWEGDLEKPVVSVLCHTYNHKPYLEDALRGFLIQKTPFPFEVILHDDASTDGTTDIVREYARRYPKIIKPVIQVENQYSQGKKPSLLSFPHSKGSWLAFCEGDDFWVTDDKLETQYDLLKKSPETLICFHSAYTLNSSGKLNNYPIKSSKKSYSVSDFLVIGGGACPTASLMLHSSVMNAMPEWFKLTLFGDFYIQVIAAYLGEGAIFLDRNMCIYRVDSENSWSSKQNENAEQRFESKMRFLPNLSDFLGNQYDDEMMVVRSKNAYSAARSLLRIGRFDASMKYIKLSFKYKFNNPVRQSAVFLLAWLKIEL